MAKLNRRDYYSAIPQLEGTLTNLTQYVTVTEGKIQTSISDLYGNYTTISNTVNGLTTEIHNEVDNRTTLIRDFNSGTITAYVGESQGVYTNASGSVDIVEITNWSQDADTGEYIPTVGSTLAKYGATGCYLYGGGVLGTEVTSSGVKIYGGSSSTYSEITSTGLEVYISGTRQASFGSTATIGNTSGTYWEFASGGLFWYHNGETETPDIALSDFNGVYTVIAPAVDCSTAECDDLYLANPDTFLVLDKTSISFTLTIPDGGNIAAATVTATKTGYYPIAIAGYNTGGPGAYFSQLRLTSASAGSATVTYRAKNVTNSQFSQTAHIDLLWVRIGDGT